MRAWESRRLRHVARSAVIGARYLHARSRAHARFARVALDELLDDIDAVPPASARASLEEVARAVVVAEKIARRTALEDTCLFRALARYAVLRWAGHAPRFVMGIDPHDPTRGHAWVMLGDDVFLEPELPVFHTTFEHAGA